MTPPPSFNPRELRRRAEDRLFDYQGNGLAAISYADQMRLGHELQVHQIELEMQNQALIDAQSEITRNLAQLTELYDLAPIAYFTLDRTGRITKSNAMARKLLGSPLLPLDHCHLSRFVARSSRVAHKEFIDRVFLHGRLESGYLTLERLTDSAAIYVFIEGIANESRQECRLVVTDLSRQHASEEALALQIMRSEELAAAKDAAEAANRAKATFVANMSHEIRTPISAILGLAHLLQRSGLNAEQDVQLDKISIATRHLLGIINDILDLSKIDAEQLTLERAPFMLDSLMAEVSSLVVDKMNEKNIDFRMEVAPVLHQCQFIGDSLHLKQILLNLLSNAVKFTERGQITLRVNGDAGNDEGMLLSFAVQDSGCGIPAEALKRIFAPFEQVDASTTRQYGGTGLGLSISRRLVELMKGELGVSSTLGSGSTFSFSIRLPRHIESSSPADSSAKLALPDAVIFLKSQHRNKHILLVEDDQIIQEVMLELLQIEISMHVDVAENGAQAIEMATRNDYHLILMDLQMPVMGGLAATRAIRQLAKHGKTPILAMTASAFDDDNQRCREAGMDDFIAKPVEPERLFAMLAKWLETTQPISQAIPV